MIYLSNVKDEKNVFEEVLIQERFYQTVFSSGHMWWIKTEELIIVLANKNCLFFFLWIFVNEMTRMAQFIRTLIFFLSIVSGNYIEPALMFNWVEFGCEHLINIIFRGGIFHFVLLQPSSIFCKPMLIICYRLSEHP